VVSFFDSIPQPPPPEPPRWHRPAWARPDTVIPGSVLAELMLIRTEHVAVAIGSVRSYPNGFEFTVHARMRDVDQAMRMGADPFHWHRRGPGAQAPDETLRLGILYADGRRAATTGGGRCYAHGPDADDGQLVLQQNGGGGNERAWDQGFWVHPLPPEGPVTLVASWLAYGVTETRAELDGNAIRAAAARTITLWPDDPDAEPGISWQTSTITAGESGTSSADAGSAQTAGDIDGS
jgi:hypothetical protein